MHDNISLLVTLSLIVIFSPYFAKVFKLPTTPVEIIFGSFLGYIGLLHEDHLFELIAEVGFLYLMFIAGTEINLKKLINIKLDLLRKIISYLALLYIFALSFVLYFHLGKIFIVLLPLISVGLVAALVKEYGKTSWLTLSMTAGAIGEVVSIAFLTISGPGLKYGIGSELIATLIHLVIFLALILLLFRVLGLLFWWFPEVSKTLMPDDDNKEQDIRLSMGLFFMLVSAMLYLDLELAFGAFIAGIFIPTFFDHKHHLPEKLGSFGFGFLIPIFFIHIGTSFKLESLLMDGLVQTSLIITFAMILMRVLAALVFTQSLGLRDSVMMGLSHSMPLTLLIAISTLAYNANSIDKLHYFALILASLIQVIVVMVSIKLINIKFPESEVKNV